MTPSVIFGIDPGFSGGIAEFWPRERTLYIHDMPVAPGQKGRQELAMRPLFDLLDSGESHATVWLEKVGARPGQGVTSMFRFGQQLGALEMAVAGNGHELRWVTPGSWKKHFGLTADKGAARKLAMDRFPDAAKMFARVKDDGRAEAALIALYGWETTR